MLAPEAYVDWINAHLGFNPRSQVNSNALSQFIAADLTAMCSEVAHDLRSSTIVSAKNAKVRTRVASRTVDLVLTELGAGPVRAAIEHKTIMASHGKARWNRYGDIIAYCNHIHNHRRESIAGATVIINCSPAYENPDAFARGLLRPLLKMEKVVADTVNIFAGIPLRETDEEPNDQPEALAVVIVDYDGKNPARLVTGDLAPQAGSPIHYKTFLERICRQYRQRFAGT